MIKTFKENDEVQFVNPDYPTWHLKKFTVIKTNSIFGFETVSAVCNQDITDTVYKKGDMVKLYLENIRPINVQLELF